MIATREDYLQAVNQATIARDVYYKTGEDSGLTDTEYDSLLDEIQLVGDTNGWTEGNALIGEVAGGIEVSGDVQHTVRMLSLGKVQSLNDVDSFVATVPGGVVLEPKLDGIALSVKYVNGKIAQVATRGDSRSGENLTEKALITKFRGLPHTLPTNETIEVRGEAFISASDFVATQAGRFAATGEKFSNSRNAVSGILRTSKDTSYATITFGAYEVIGYDNDSYSQRMKHLATLGFAPAMTFMPADILTAKIPLSEKIERFGNIREKNDAPTDGVVVKADSEKTRKSMGEGSRHPKWAVAFKFEAEQAATVLNGVQREVGKTGNVSYVAQLTPVEVDGSVVSKATLNNATFINKLDLHIGDTVIIRKANDIIPEIVSVDLALRPESAVKYDAPTTCPKCGNDLDTASSVIWKCHNPDCAALNKVVYAVSRDILDVDNLSTAIIERLFAGNLIQDTGDLFMLTEKQLAGLVMSYSKDKTGKTIIPLKAQYLGEKMAAKIYGNLQTSKNQDLNRIISALGIRMTGRTFGRRLAKHFGSMQKLQAATINDLLEVEGIAIGRAEVIHAGIQNARPLITKLYNAGFTALNEKNSQETLKKAEASSTDKLKGLNVVVTGTVEGYSRNQLTELVESNGGHASSSVSSKTDLVVLGEKAGSKKAKAESLGVKTMPADAFITWITK